ncbi:YcxB family protein [Thermodesulfobacteriota bacterium]
MKIAPEFIGGVKMGNIGFIMKIKFDSTLDDVTEYRFGLFTRRTTYKTNRWVGVVGSFLGVGIAFLLLENYSNAELPLWLPLLLSGIGAIVYLVFYPDITRRKIKNYIPQTLKDQLPCPTTYTITEGHILCDSFNKETSYAMSDLVNVKEDERHIQLSFGPKDLLVIPKRAFESIDEIDHFKNILNSEKSR